MAMPAISYIRDCIFDPNCNLEDNVELDSDNNQLWFIKNNTKSQKFDYNLATPLISKSTQKQYLLYGIYIFAINYNQDEWADYIMEAQLECNDLEQGLNDKNVTYIIDSGDQFALYDYLHANSHIFNALSKTQLSPPKALTFNDKKRKLESQQDHDHHAMVSKQPPIKKQKLTSIKHEMDANNHSNSSLFTENYNMMTMDGTSSGRMDRFDDRMDSDFKPFWQTLPDPKPNKLSMDNDNKIDWKNNYRSRIRESATRNSILNNKKSFNDVATLFPKISRTLQQLVRAGAASKQQKQRFILSQSEKTIRSRTERPIIIVPYSNNSLLSFSNCLSFLQEFRYIPASSIQQAHHHNHHKKKNENKSGSSPPSSSSSILLERKSNLDGTSHKKAVFEIRSSSSFTKNTPISEWNRIVAIFVIGKQWQFKKWINGWRRPEEIFNKTAGFYLHFADDPPSGNVKNWRVNYLPIQRNVRHDDARIVNQFWKRLYQHLRSKHRNKKLFY